MSNPGNAATQTENTKSDDGKEANTTNTTDTTKVAETFEDKVNAAAAAATIDTDSGKRIFPEGTPEEVEYAANAELRRRDTQSSYTKTQQTLKQTEAELKTVKKFSKPIPKVELTEEQREELDDLKLSNPEAWRVKINALENEAILKAEKEHKENLQEALTANELERRKSILETFNNDNPNLVNLTDDVIDNDVPPRYKQRLEAGEITFEQFLEDVKTYLSQGKVVQKDNLENGQPNLSNVGGSSKPGQQAVEMDDTTTYETEIY